MQKNLASLVNRYAAIAVGAAAFVGLSSPAFAAFPERPVRIIVPFSPGGGTDLISRLLGDGMSRELGQPVIVENKPGAGTTIGSDDVARSKPDGYTLLMATFAHAINPSLRPNLPSDRKTVVSGKSGAVRDDLGGRTTIKK